MEINVTVTPNAKVAMVIKVDERDYKVKVIMGSLLRKAGQTSAWLKFWQNISMFPNPT